MVAVNISGGLHNARGQIANMDKKFRERAAKALIKLKEKHEQELLAEWCKEIGWSEEKAQKAAEEAEANRAELLELDRKGREEKRARRLAAKV